MSIVQEVFKLLFGTPTDEDLAKQRQHIVELAVRVQLVIDKQDEKESDLVRTGREIAKLTKERADLLKQLGESHLKEVK